MLKEKSCQQKRKLRQAVTLCNWGRLFLGPIVVPKSTQPRGAWAGRKEMALRRWHYEVSNYQMAQSEGYYYLNLDLTIYDSYQLKSD